MPVGVTIKTRRGTAAEWAAANPTLAAGEPGYETDTGILKYGDGVTAYNSLPARVPTSQKTTRSATIVIAASNSSEKSKAQADYVCDGINDEVEIQAAINSLSPLGGTIKLSEGKFVIHPGTPVYVSEWRAAIVLTSSDNNVHITGSHGTIIEFTEGNVVPGADGIIMFYLDHCDNFSISECIFDGKQDTQTATYVNALFSKNSTNYSYSKNHFRNTKWAIWGDGFSDGGIIEKNILDIAGTFGIALHNNPNLCIVRNNLIIAPVTGIFVDSVSHCIIEGNTIKNPSWSGINVWDDNHNCIITNNVITQTGPVPVGIGINVYTNEPPKPESDGIFVSGNLISKMATGIIVCGAGNTVKGNMMVACTTPIETVGQGVIVEGNIPQDTAYIANLAARGTYHHIPTNDGFKSTLVGTGGVSQTPFELGVYTGTGTSVQNSAVAYSQAFGMCTATISRAFTSFSLPHELIFNYTAVASDDENVIRRVQYKESNAEGALNAKGFGIRVNNLSLIGESYGTELGEIDLSTLTNGKTVQIKIKHTPGVKIEWFVNGEIVGSQVESSKIPTGSSNNPMYFVHSIISGNPGIGTNAQSFISAPKLWVGLS